MQISSKLFIVYMKREKDLSKINTTSIRYTSQNSVMAKENVFWLPRNIWDSMLWKSKIDNK